MPYQLFLPFLFISFSFHFYWTSLAAVPFSSLSSFACCHPFVPETKSESLLSCCPLLGLAWLSTSTQSRLEPCRTKVKAKEDFLSFPPLPCFTSLPGNSINSIPLGGRRRPMAGLAPLQVAPPPPRGRQTPPKGVSFFLQAAHCPAEMSSSAKY